MNKQYLTSLKVTYDLDVDIDKLPFVIDENILNYTIDVCKIWNAILNGKCSDAILTPALPRGNVDAEIMIIAQNPGGRGKDRKYSTIWNDGPNSKFVMDVVNKSDIFDNVWFTNLVPYPTEDNRITKKQIEETEYLLHMQLNVIQPKVLIGLGGVVNNYLEKNYKDKYQIIKLSHPAYVRRFLSGDPINKENYINGFRSAKFLTKGVKNENKRVP